MSMWTQRAFLSGVLACTLVLGNLACAAELAPDLPGIEQPPETLFPEPSATQPSGPEMEPPEEDTPPPDMSPTPEPTDPPPEDSEPPQQPKPEPPPTPIPTPRPTRPPGANDVLVPTPAPTSPPDAPKPTPGLPPGSNDVLVPKPIPSAPPDGPEPPEPSGPSSDVVYTEEALSKWLGDHVQEGGTVYLGADLRLTTRCAGAAPRSPVQIVAGEHTIRLAPGVVWRRPGMVTVSGSGTVFYVEDGARLELFSDNVVSAQGDGAVAVVTESPTGLVMDYGHISAEGAGATGIYAPGSLVLTTASISADGVGATAVRSGGGADLTYCTIRASGMDSTAVRAEGEVILDTSLVQPYPVGAVEYTRSAELETTHQYYVELGAPELPLPNLFWAILTAEGREDLRIRVPIVWEGADFPTDEEAVFTLTVELVWPFPEIPLDYRGQHQWFAYVLDPARPRLISATASEKFVYLYLFRSHSGIEEYLVHYSLNSGEDWKTYSWTRKSATTLRVPNVFEPESTILFYYDEVYDDGTVLRSNLLEVYLGSDGTVLSTPGNGDYDGGDRGGSTSPEPPFGWPEPPVPEMVPPSPSQTPPPANTAPTPNPRKPNLTAPVPIPVVQLDPIGTVTAAVPTAEPAPPAGETVPPNASPVPDPEPSELPPTPAPIPAPSDETPTDTAPTSTPKPEDQTEAVRQSPDQPERTVPVIEASHGAEVPSSREPRAKRFSQPVVAVAGVTALLSSILLGLAICRRRS